MADMDISFPEIVSEPAVPLVPPGWPPRVLNKKGSLGIIVADRGHGMAFARDVVLVEHGIAPQGPHLPGYIHSEHNRNPASQLFFHLDNGGRVKSRPPLDAKLPGAFKLRRRRLPPAPATVEGELLDRQRSDIAQQIQRCRDFCAGAAPLIARDLIVRE